MQETPGRRGIEIPSPGSAVLGAALLVLAGCSSPPPASKGNPKPPRARTATTSNAPAPFIYPAPVSGHYEEINTGKFDLVDGIASAPSGGGTLVYVTEKSIASPVLAGSTCPLTQARALTLLRNAAFLEVDLDVSGRSSYFAGGSPYGGRGREKEVGGRYWRIGGGKVKDGRVAGSVTYKRRGGFEFDLPVTKPGVSEVSEGDFVSGQPAGEAAPTPSEEDLIAVYAAVRRAALARDLNSMLAAQGFDPKQIEAIRGLPGIDDDLGAHADRFLEPGEPEEPSTTPGRGSVAGRGKNSKGEDFMNFYQFTPCGDNLVLVSIGLNPQ